MRIVITGGAGFLGMRLARKLLERGTLTDAGGQKRDIRSLVRPVRIMSRRNVADWREGLAGSLARKTSREALSRSLAVLSSWSAM